MRRFIVLLILTAVLLSGCAKFAESTKDTATYDSVASPDEATEIPTEPPTDPPTIDELAQARYDAILSGELSNDYGLIDNVEPLGQLNGMQAGCEAMALTAALNHFGYDLGIDDIVDDYMVYDDNFVTGYLGNPRRFYEGAGIYPPGMLTTIWNFIEENDADLYPFDTTGLSMDELYKFIQAGCPVLIWTSYNRRSPNIEQTYEYEGISYPWFSSEHCVCLHGYDLEDDEVKVADSWNNGSDDWEDASRFEDVYDEIGQFSVVLMDTSDLY